MHHEYATQDGSLDMGCSDFELLKRVRIDFTYVVCNKGLLYGCSAISRPACCCKLVALP